MSNIPTTKEKLFFWSAFSGLSSILIASSTYLFKTLFDNDPEPSNPPNIIPNEQPDASSYEINPNELKETDLYLDGTLTKKGIAILYYHITKLGEALIKKEYPTLESDRRSNVDNTELFSQYAGQSIKASQVAWEIASKTILSKLSNKLTFEELSDKFQSFDPNEFDDIIVRIYPLSEDDKKVEPSTAKEALQFYTNLSVQGFEELHAQFKPSFAELSTEEEKIQMFTIYKINEAATKTKIDDKLFMKYNLKEISIKTILYRNNLYNDNEVKECLKKLNEINKGLTIDDIK